MADRKDFILMKVRLELNVEYQNVGNGPYSFAIIIFWALSGIVLDKQSQWVSIKFYLALIGGKTVVAVLWQGKQLILKTFQKVG